MRIMIAGSATSVDLKMKLKENICYIFPLRAEAVPLAPFKPFIAFPIDRVQRQIACLQFCTHLNGRLTLTMPFRLLDLLHLRGNTPKGFVLSRGIF